MPLVVHTVAEIAAADLAAWRATAVCTKLQAKIALEAVGRWAEVKAMIAADPALQETWDLAVELPRASAIIETMAALLSPPLTDPEIDALYQVAMQVEI